MKKGRKALSVLLSAAMVLSAAGGGLSAFAEEVSQSSDPVSTAEEAIAKVNADNTNIAADPKEDQKEQYDAKVALYNSAVKAYKDVPEESRDALDAEMMVKFLKGYIDREAYLDVEAKDPNGKITNADRQAVMESLSTDLGAHGERDAAVSYATDHLWTAIEGITPAGSGNGSSGQTPALEKLSADQLKNVVAALQSALEALSTMSQDSMVYLGGLGTAYASNNANFYTPYFTAVRPSYNYVKNLIVTYGQALEVQTPWEEEIPSKPKAPNNTALYDDAYRNYLEDSKAYHEALEQKTIHQSRYYLDAIKLLAKEGSAISPAMNVWMDLYDAFVDFRENQNIEKGKEAVEQYNQVNADPFQKSILSSTGSISPFYYAPYFSGKDWVYSNYGLSALNTQVFKDVLIEENQTAYHEFTAFIEELNLDEATNDQVEQAKEMYKSLKSAFKYNTSDDVMWRYYDVLCTYTPESPANTPSDDQFENELDAWEQTEVAYPEYETATPENIQTYIIDALDETLSSLLGTLIPEIGEAGGLQGYFTRNVYTNQSISVILSLYQTLGSLDIPISVGGMELNIGTIIADSVKPSELAKWLTEEKFSGAVEKVNAAIETSGDTTDSYASVTFENGDWGFEDGNREGFIHAFAAVLRPIVDLITGTGPVGGIVGPVLYMPNTVELDGNYTYGAYEYLIPIFEGLGMKGIISSEQYSDAFAAAETDGTKMDAAILPILNPIFDLIEQILSSPVNELLNLLPRLAYLVDSGILNNSVKSALSTSSLLSGLTGSLDLSADSINAMIASLIPTIFGENTLFTLEPIDWNALAHAGTLSVNTSVVSTNQYRLEVLANKPDVFLLTANYLFDNLIGNETNWDEIYNLLSGIDAIKDYLPILDSLIQNTIRPLGVNGLLQMFLPQPPENGGNSDVSGTSPDVSSPDTGDTALISAVTVFALSGTALYFLNKGKKRSK